MPGADHLERIAAALVSRGVNFVVIGGWALEAQGFDMGYKTTDIDFTPDLSADNLERLSEALYDLGAEIRAGDESMPFNHTGDSLGQVAMWNLTCEEGDFDLTFEPSGLSGYRELLRSCHVIPVEVDGEQIDVPCADLADILRSKEAAKRPKDLAVLPILHAQLEMRNSRRTRGSDTGGGVGVGN